MSFDQEILDAFADESLVILEEVEETLDALEDPEGNGESFASVAQKIDRIMGCATSLGLNGSEDLSPIFKMVGELSEGCKFLGYRAESLNNPMLSRIVSGVIGEAVELISDSLSKLKKGYVYFDADATKRSKERIKAIASKIRLTPEEQEEMFKKFGVVIKD